MKTLFVSIACIAPILGFAADPNPHDYLKGSFSRDVVAAVEKAKRERKPVWITAWDDKFKDSAGGEGLTRYHLRCFFAYPETQKLLKESFVQVFTTMDNKFVEQWMDKNDKTHVPVYVILDRTGKFVQRKQLYANPGVALKEVQDAIASLK